MKRLLKTIADGLAVLLVSPGLLLYAVGVLIIGREKAFPGWSQVLSLIPGLSGVFLRRAFYRFALQRCGPDSCISFGSVFSDAGASVGRGAYVGLNCILGCVTIEDDVLISSNVSVMNGAGQHGVDRLDIPIREQPGVWPRVTIGRDSWIGDRSIIMADVGKHCIIGAGSIVTKPIPDYAVAVGAPAQVVRLRKEDSSTASEPHQPEAPAKER